MIPGTLKITLKGPPTIFKRKKVLKMAFKYCGMYTYEILGMIKVTLLLFHNDYT